MSFLTAADPLNARAVALQLAALLPHVAAESGLDLLSPYFCDDAGDLPEIVNMEAAARIHAETFGNSDGLPFYFHLIEALGLISVPTFHPMEGRDGPWLVGDGLDLWSAPNELTARMVAAAVEAAGMDPYVECFLSDHQLAAAEAASDDASDDASADDAGDAPGWAYACGFTVHWFSTESAARAAHDADLQRVLDGEYPSGCLGSVERCSHREAAEWAAPHTPCGEW